MFFSWKNPVFFWQLKTDWKARV